ncbi:MAG: HYExAFE family protein [Planctomycetota bacterium]
MVDRGIHYEAAFEAFLRERATPYVAVDEAKRALFGKAKLKGFDFLVYSRNGPNLLVDVKGRRATGGKSMQTWATQRDVDDLLQWEQVFGEDFQAVLAFAYWIEPRDETLGLPGLASDLPPGEAEEPGVFRHLSRWYRLMAISLADYRNHMRQRSAKWETVALPTSDFRSLARPMETLL